MWLQAAASHQRNNPLLTDDNRGISRYSSRKVSSPLGTYPYFSIPYVSPAQAPAARAAASTISRGYRTRLRVLYSYCTVSQNGTVLVPSEFSDSRCEAHYPHMMTMMMMMMMMR